MEALSGMLDIVEVDFEARSNCLFEFFKKGDLSDAKNLLKEWDSDNPRIKQHQEALRSMASHLGDNPYAQNPISIISKQLQGIGQREKKEFLRAQDAWFDLILMRAEYFKFSVDRQGKQAAYLTHCFNCGEPAKKRCSICKKIHYCSPECQRIDWVNHKRVCSKTEI